PKDLIEISDKELIDKLSALVEELEDNDDVQYVEGNFTFVDAV
ncbi:MAG: YebC/PmpR family DNA-binding transcriptional regulator, partial [Wolbachia sp.]